MNLKEAQVKLKEARAKARELRKEIDELREAVRRFGGDPDTRLNFTARNKKIYKRWKDGATYAELAKEHKISKATIGQVCRKIDYILEYRKAKFKEYTDLLKCK